jgi:hypothetical protein
VLGTLGRLTIHSSLTSDLVSVFSLDIFRLDARASALARLSVSSFVRGVPTVLTDAGDMLGVPSLGGIGGFEDDWRL